MAYLANLSARAQRDLAQIYRRINADDSDAALKWYRGFKQEFLTLEVQPNRCPVTPDNDKLRHLLYGNKPHIYRAIHRVARSTSGWTCSISGTAQEMDSRGPMLSDPASCSVRPSIAPTPDRFPSGTVIGFPSE